MTATPALSVILATPDNYQTIRKTVQYLRAQTVHKQIELLVVAPSVAALGLVEQELEGFHSYCVVEVGSIRSAGAANAAGIRRARAPVVALAEDHSFPQPGWAEALLQAHSQPWAAVGPAILNANPQNSISWADLLMGYGPWIKPAPAGEVDFLPGHNSSYKRDLLLQYGPALESMLESETVLHWDLRAKGHRLYLEPAAQTAHTNFSLTGSWLKACFYNGRTFAATRAQQGGWSWLRRLAYAGGSPLIPLVRLWRILRDLSRPGRPLGLGIRVVPQLLLGLSADGLGQMVGYAFGAGAARQRLMKYEYHRDRHIAQSPSLAGSAEEPTEQTAPRK